VLRHRLPAASKADHMQFQWREKISDATRIVPSRWTKMFFEFSRPFILLAFGGWLFDDFI
jgi:hypothetical protein